MIVNQNRAELLIANAVHYTSTSVLESINVLASTLGGWTGSLGLVLRRRATWLAGLLRYPNTILQVAYQSAGIFNVPAIDCLEAPVLELVVIIRSHSILYFERQSCVECSGSRPRSNDSKLFPTPSTSAASTVRTLALVSCANSHF